MRFAVYYNFDFQVSPLVAAATLLTREEREVLGDCFNGFQKFSRLRPYIGSQICFTDSLVFIRLHPTLEQNATPCEHDYAVNILIPC